MISYLKGRIFNLLKWALHKSTRWGYRVIRDNDLYTLYDVGVNKFANILVIAHKNENQLLSVYVSVFNWPVNFIIDSYSNKENTDKLKRYIMERLHKALPVLRVDFYNFPLTRIII